MEGKVTGAGILAIERKTGKILLGRRGLEGKEPNTWSPFGGTYDEKDQHPRKTALREFFEECGCKVKFELSKMPFYTCDDNHVKFYTYIGIFDDEFEITLSDENVDYGWFDIEHLPENLHSGVQRMIDDKLKALLHLKNYYLGLKS